MQVTLALTNLLNTIRNKNPKTVIQQFWTYLTTSYSFTALSNHSLKGKQVLMT